MKLLKEVDETIRKHSMIIDEDHILIGLSGGADSVCLSVILKLLKMNYHLTVSAVYINHGLRIDEAEKEKSFCLSLSKSLGQDFYVRTINAGNKKDIQGKSIHERKNLHDFLREQRYLVLKKLAFEIDASKIAIGHTIDDQAETIIMHLLRGSGKRGLSGIPPVNGNIIRPLIETSRVEIEKFLVGKCIQFVTDSSNLKDIYLRNRIRNQLMSKLKTFNPNLLKTISRFADINREEEDFLELTVSKEMENLLSGKTESFINLLMAPLKLLNKALQRRVIRRAIESLQGLRGISANHVEDILKLVDVGRTGSTIHLPGNIRAVKGYSALMITNELPKKITSTILKIPGKIYLHESSTVMETDILNHPDEFDVSTANLKKLPGESLKESGKNIASFDLDRITVPLNIRSRRPGDFFYPEGLGKKKKLQDFFVDKKIPREKRDLIPLVISGDDIIWVGGYRRDERFKVTGKTKKSLIIRLFLCADEKKI